MQASDDISGDAGRDTLVMAPMQLDGGADADVLIGGEATAADRAVRATTCASSPATPRWIPRQQQLRGRQHRHGLVSSGDSAEHAGERRDRRQRHRGAHPAGQRQQRDDPEAIDAADDDDVILVAGHLHRNG